jgi:hypothetical protein
MRLPWHDIELCIQTCVNGAVIDRRTHEQYIMNPPPRMLPWCASVGATQRSSHVMSVPARVHVFVYASIDIQSPMCDS